MVLIVVGRNGEGRQSLISRAMRLNADLALAPRGDMATIVYGISSTAIRSLETESASKIDSKVCDHAYLRTENVQSILDRLREDANNIIID